MFLILFPLPCFVSRPEHTGLVRLTSSPGATGKAASRQCLSMRALRGSGGPWGGGEVVLSIVS